MKPTKKTKPTPRITVVVNIATTPMDFDHWAANYVRAAIAVDRAMQHDSAEAA